MHLFHLKQCKIKSSPLNGEIEAGKVTNAFFLFFPFPVEKGHNCGHAFLAHPPLLQEIALLPIDLVQEFPFMVAD